MTAERKGKKICCSAISEQALEAEAKASETGAERMGSHRRIQEQDFTSNNPGPGIGMLCSPHASARTLER
ncbi:uncharacterized protein MYCFIDRAFT_174970 [Pseudocercospora fijiensis CIRAD86]|uniref:Uncharacterized protein n=1 Tax=Pseudocercospora fijiensis (strain CIRAD86) TaxID=383855 RepID=M2ZX26_PSEFD|nr:uncharacterized protein MYCFIDRAFT_174970 [Pseudocercospora fijiensis CIRAD86]EME83544.1 hypothetical protein MYCFIDRAFT_174970 [Pseudocercospora fijiensis CIRAD86]